MKELVSYLAKALVDDPGPVEVEESGSDADRVFHLKVAADDLGKVIGKRGRTAKALRTLLTAVAAQQGGRVTLEIVEPDAGPNAGPGSEGEAAEASAG